MLMVEEMLVSKKTPQWDLLFGAVVLIGRNWA
jgi:hypothetical protein